MTDVEYKLNAIEVVEKLIHEQAQESIIKNDLDSVEVFARTKEGMSKLRAKLLTKDVMFQLSQPNQRPDGDKWC